jgi:hypothetical protein
MSERDDLIRKFIEEYDELLKKALGTTFTDATKSKVAKEKRECVDRLLDSIKKLEPLPRDLVIAVPTPAARPTKVDPEECDRRYESTARQTVEFFKNQDQEKEKKHTNDKKIKEFRAAAEAVKSELVTRFNLVDDPLESILAALLDRHAEQFERRLQEEQEEMAKPY